MGTERSNPVDLERRDAALPTERNGRTRGNGLLKVGLVGTIVTTLCCFTPLLVLLLGALGLSAVIVWLDFLLLPALVVFLFITGYALWKRQNAPSS